MGFAQPPIIIQLSEYRSSECPKKRLLLCRMTSRPDFVVVDDTSTTQPERISYSAGWVALPMPDGVAGTGPPLFKTVHVALSPASFTFTYNGAAGPLFVMGSLLSESIPTWNCTLDNEPMNVISNVKSIVPIVSNHVQLCSFDSQTIPVGDHTIRVSVTASEANPAFFDYILYTPGSEVSPSGDLFFNSTNVGMKYTGPGWKNDGSNIMATSNPGDTLDFVFNGHSVSWVGSFDGTQGKTSANATYSIDGSTPVDFTFENPLKAFSASTVMTEQVFFQTEPLVPGEHHLQVIYHGAIGSTPLALDHLIIQNSTTDFSLTPMPAVSSRESQSTVFSSPQRGSPSTDIFPTATQLFPTPSAHTSPTISHVRASHIGRVAGICIGISLVLCVVIFFGRRVRRARRRTTSQIPSQFALPFYNSNRTPLVPEKGRRRSSANTFLDTEQQSRAPISSARAGKAGRLAEATAAALRRYHSRSRRTPPDPIAQSNEPSTTNGMPPRIVMHQDSGVPLPQPDGGEAEVIEVPPAYASIR